MTKPRVLLSLPHMGSHSAANTIAVETMLLTDKRVDLQVARTTGVPFENNINQLVLNFLQGDWDYWINLDEDEAPLNNPIDLVFLDKDVIGLPAPGFKLNQPDAEHPFYWMVYSWDEAADSYRPYQMKRELGPLQEVDAVSSGCWVVARRVLEAVKQPLSSLWDENGLRKMGGDLHFCTKARAAGFKIYAHYEYPCRHFKTVDLYEVMRLLAAAKERKT
ncbi:MAG: hypothetical protein MI746_13015 [Pseudomonadales bacterium]|nr:hypothetical protein [Pseudomonadales bacterium]